jgi:hypothetical protein
MGRSAPFHSADFSTYLCGELSRQTRQSLVFRLTSRHTALAGLPAGAAQVDCSRPTSVAITSAMSR